MELVEASRSNARTSDSSWSSSALIIADLADCALCLEVMRFAYVRDLSGMWARDGPLFRESSTGSDLTEGR